MSYSVYAYLTDRKKVSAVYGSGNRKLFTELSQSLKEDLENIDKSFPDKVNSRRNSSAVLQDIINGNIHEYIWSDRNLF